jgi:hypothetical protein
VENSEVGLMEGSHDMMALRVANLAGGHMRKRWACGPVCGITKVGGSGLEGAVALGGVAGGFDV